MAGERIEHPSHVAQFLGIEHLVENGEDMPLFLSYSHGVTLSECPLIW